MNLIKILTISMMFSCLAFATGEENLAREQREQAELNQEIETLKKYIYFKINSMKDILKEFYAAIDERHPLSTAFSKKAYNLKMAMNSYKEYVEFYNLNEKKDKLAYIKLMIINEALNKSLDRLSAYFSNYRQYMLLYAYKCPEKYKYLRESQEFIDEWNRRVGPYNR